MLKSGEGTGGLVDKGRPFAACAYCSTLRSGGREFCDVSRLDSREAISVRHACRQPQFKTQLPITDWRSSCAQPFLSHADIFLLVCVACALCASPLLVCHGALASQYRLNADQLREQLD